MLRDVRETTMTAAGLDRTAGAYGPSNWVHPGADLTTFGSQRPLQWRRQLPELVSSRVRLRELRLTDAPSLTETLGSPTVGRYLSCSPASIVETEEFIAWTRRARMAGRYICFGVIPPGADSAVGVFQLWPLEPSFRTAEWGFALGHRFWGSGLFVAGARLVMGFVFDTLEVQRLEARVAVDNNRGNGALKKLGAVPEGVLRKCFLTDGAYRDHVMWSILATDWRAANNDSTGRVAGEVA